MSLTLLKISCPDRVGLLSRITSFVAHHGGNFIEVNQFTEQEAKWFFARLAIDTSSLALNLDALRKAFTPLAGDLDADWSIREDRENMRVIILVSKLSHCLVDLLWRWRSGELRIDIPLVISNHPDLRETVEREGLEFRHIPVDPQNKGAAFSEMRDLFHERQPGGIVLARYMQILPADICEEFYGKIINIHHSFLPSFVGANPYRRAYERGVKLIGATCHYATADLDQGPIIDQEVVRVEHFHAPDDLLRLGRDCERLALARGVRYHADDRVLLHGTRTIVFHD